MAWVKIDREGQMEIVVKGATNRALWAIYHQDALNTIQSLLLGKVYQLP
jgi:hypothetical protein